WKRALAVRKPELTSALKIRVGRKPKLARMIGTTAFMPIAPTAVENVTRPDWNGVIWKPSCRSSGIRKGSAPTPARKMKPPPTLAGRAGGGKGDGRGGGGGGRRAWMM